MHQQAQSPSLDERKRLFTEAQRILADELPGIYFVTPKVTLAISSRVVNPTAGAAAPAVALERRLACRGAARR